MERGVRMKLASIKRIILRFLLYVAIAVSSLLVIAFFIFLRAKTGVFIPVRWGGLALWTGVLVVIFCKYYRRQWHRSDFWITLTILICLHLGIFIPLLRSYTDWGLGWFFTTTMLEVVPMFLVFEKVFHRTRKPHHSPIAHR